MEKNSPEGTSRSMPATASTSSNRLVRATSCTSPPPTAPPFLSSRLDFRAFFFPDPEPFFLGFQVKPSTWAANRMAVVKARWGSTTGSSSAIWMANPSSRADSVMANSSASTLPNSPEAWPSRTTPAMVSRQWASNSSRTRATSGWRTDCAQRSSHSAQESGSSASASGRQVMATISSSRAAALSITSMRRAPRSYHWSSA